jgi:hypothetical protein
MLPVLTAESSALMANGRKAGEARAVDLLIAATALSAGLPFYTRNGEDLQALDGLVEVVVLWVTLPALWALGPQEHCGDIGTPNDSA